MSYYPPQDKLPVQKNNPKKRLYQAEELMDRMYIFSKPKNK